MCLSTLMPTLDKNHPGKVDRFCDLALTSKIPTEGGLKLSIRTCAITMGAGVTPFIY